MFKIFSNQAVTDKKREPTQQVQTVSDDCKVSEKDIYDFISVSAHQLKTPITAVKWSLEVLKNGEVKNEKEAGILYEKMYDSCTRALSLIDKMLSAYKLESESAVFEFEPGDDLGDLLEREISEIRVLADKKKISINSTLAAGTPTGLYFDHAKVQDVIQNLLENAVRYTPEGGKIIVTYLFNETEAEINIADSGVGIRKDDQKNIFQKFYRASNVKMENRGNGLGLFICKNVVEKHGGKIWFESEEGKGTRFHFTLPMGKKVNIKQ